MANCLLRKKTNDSTDLVEGSSPPRDRPSRVCQRLQTQPRRADSYSTGSNDWCSRYKAKMVRTCVASSSLTCRHRPRGSRPLPTIRRQMRAVEVLGRIGTPEAQKLLECWRRDQPGRGNARSKKSVGTTEAAPLRQKPHQLSSNFSARCTNPCGESTRAAIGRVLDSFLSSRQPP